MRIFKNTLSGSHVDVEVQPGDTVGDVKSKIQEVAGYPIEKQQLAFAGKQLEDKWLLTDCRIQNFHCMVLTLRGSLHISVRLPNDRTLLLNAEASDTVARVKAKIDADEGIDPAKQRLFFEGQELEDSATLYTQTGKVQMDDAMHLVLRISREK